MSVYQRAINYETLVKVSVLSESCVYHQFQHFKSLCAVDIPLIDNVAFYSEYFHIGSSVLVDEYKNTEKSFKSLPDDVFVIDRSDKLWPKNVENIEFLYLRGRKELLSIDSLSIVGTRDPSSKGKKRAEDIVDSLNMNFSVISGLARGIDFYVHSESIRKGIPTVAVLGTNLCISYPPENRALQEYIANNGLLISQFAPCRNTEKYFFMKRNKLMSEISCGSVVAESKDCGGGVKQALFSEKQGKPVFIFHEDFDNKSLGWPQLFANPVLINSGYDINAFFIEKRTDLTVQPSLF